MKNESLHGDAIRSGYMSWKISPVCNNISHIGLLTYINWHILNNKYDIDDKVSYEWHLWTCCSSKQTDAY